MIWMRGFVPVLLVTVGLVSASVGMPRPSTHLSPAPKGGKVDAEQIALARFTGQYCVSCHNDANKSGGLALDQLSKEAIDQHPEVWERVVRKLRARQMPPVEGTRPDERSYEVLSSWLETALDRAASSHPDPGRTETFRRLTATEYQNAIRDLLELQKDGASLLPQDPPSNKFDNITVGDLSPTLMDRYLSAAQKISRLAGGSTG